ncbi:ABC transporter permease [Clostridium thermobutyricum]
MSAVIKNVILRVFRNPKYLIFSALFPIFLVLILGNLLSNANDSVSFEQKTVYYMQNNPSSQIMTDFNAVKDNIDKSDIKFDFKKVSNKEESLKNVDTNGYIFLELNKDSIKIYVNKNNEKYYTYLDAIFKSVDKSIETGKEIFKISPEKATSILKSNENINVKVLPKEKAPSGFDYYSVAEITMMCLYIMLFPISGYFEDKKNKTRERMKIAGISNKKYFLGSILGYCILSFLITAPGFIFTKFVLHANWGTQPLLYYVAIQLLAFMIIILGMIIIYIFDDMDKIIGVIQGIIFPMLSFLGGAYISIPYGKNTLGIFGYITYISPIRWINQGIFLSIYNGENSFLIKTMIGFLIAIAIFLVILLQITRKDEARI